MMYRLSRNNVILGSVMLLVVIVAIPLVILGVKAFTGAGKTQPESAAASQQEGSSSSSGGSSGADEIAAGTCMKPSDVDRSEVDSVAYATVSIEHCWDATKDRTRTAGAIRAKPLMSQDWAAKQVEPERNSLQGQFSQAAEFSGYSVPEVSPVGGDANQDVAADKKARAYTVEWTWQNQDGKKIEGGSERVVIYLEQHGGQWQVVGEQSSTTSY